ncbi:uncharacterized protein [Macrobrachium rosenbergii]|uniref:uncharacterized protein n=1 Tax=Macrobrachium rosenbergii TaxID=79674 RepID=UPI0034D68BB7
MTRPFQLFTDASLDHVGAVLMQESDGLLKPVGYLSKKLKPVEQRYSTTDREALAIVLACRRFHHFLWGTMFTIHTDHQPLLSVFKRKTKSPRMNIWIIEMQDYRFKVVYRPGKHKEVADQLSRPVRVIFHNNQDNYLGLRCVILDNGAEFTSQQFRDLCQKHNINTGFITPYHPKGNSISERMHRTMKTLLNVTCQGHTYQWPTYLGETQPVLNCAVHATTGEQPHYVFFSRRPAIQIITTSPSIDDEVSDPDITKVHEIIQKTHLQRSKTFVSIANRKRVNTNVEKNSLVWVRNETQIPGTSQKLNVKWLGPYRVIEVVQDGSTYVLKNLFDDTIVE